MPLDIATVDGLRRPIRGQAEYDLSGVFTVGAYADGSPARLAITRDGARICHTTVVGNDDTGKSSLLSSMISAAEEAGLSVEVIDSYASDLYCLGHADAHPAEFAAQILTEHLKRAAQPDHLGRGRARPRQLLVIDGLHLHGDDRCVIETLARLSSIAAGAGIALLVATQLVTLGLFGRPACAVRTRLVLTENLVQLRTFDLPGRALGGVIPAIPPAFPGGGSTAGVGRLPGDDQLFRAWLS